MNNANFYYPANAAASSSSAAHRYPKASSSSPAGPSAAPSVAGPSNNGLNGPYVRPRQDLNDFLESFWQRQMENVEREDPDFKTYNLPLARIKKVMKSDEEVKMISAEVMFSKACEIFISELTCRAWLVAEAHKRRTLQKSDVAAAIAFSDMFDFLIDIIPRDGDEGRSEGRDGEADDTVEGGDYEAGDDVLDGTATCGEAAPHGVAGSNGQSRGARPGDVGLDERGGVNGEGGEWYYSEYIEGEGDA